MALNTFVIINNITNLSDARYCAGMGVDVLGFTLEPGQPASVPQTAFKEITGWVAGVQLLGEFREMELLEINQVAEENNLDFVLLNHVYPLRDVEKISKPVILRIDLKADATLSYMRSLMEAYFSEVEFFLIDSEEITALNEKTLGLLRDLSDIFPVIIGFGLSAENILHVLETVKPGGICLKGGNELKPGLRDFNELADILELLQPEED